jgi:hypothetical protein
MQRAPAFILVALATAGSNYLGAEPEVAVEIGISEIGTCLLRNLNFPCSDLGAKLRIPRNVQIHLSVDPKASYYAIGAALEGLRQTGFKLGYANVKAQ